MGNLMSDTATWTIQLDPCTYVDVQLLTIMLMIC